MEIPWDTYPTGNNHYMNRDDHYIWASKRCHVNQIKHFCTSIVFESILWVIRLYTLDVSSAKQPWKVRAEAWDPLDFQMIQTSNLTQTKKTKKKHTHTVKPTKYPNSEEMIFFCFLVLLVEEYGFSNLIREGTRICPFRNGRSLGG